MMNFAFIQRELLIVWWKEKRSRWSYL